MTKIISFDLDGTLVKKSYGDKVWLEGIPILYAKEKNISFEKAQKYLKQKYKEIGKDQAEWYNIQYWFKKLDITASWGSLLQKYKSYVEVFPYAGQVVKRLNKKFKLVLISNACREFIEVELKESKLRRYFFRIFSSTTDYNSTKKHNDVYIKICRKLSISPDNMIHIGDDKKFDYTTPKRIGIHSFYLDRNRIYNGNNVVFSLKEFEKRIREIQN